MRVILIAFVNEKRRLVLRGTRRLFDEAFRIFVVKRQSVSGSFD